MSDIHASLSGLSGIARDVDGVRDALSDLDDLVVDHDGLGAPDVGDGVAEIRDGWRVRERELADHLTRLAAFVDAVADAFAMADGSIVTGDA